jgi:hypothetical protein
LADAERQVTLFPAHTKVYQEGPVSSAKRLTKRQLKDDKFVDVVFQYWELFKRYLRPVVAVVAVVVAVILLVTWGLRFQRSSRAESHQEFSSALSILGKAMDSQAPEDYLAAETAFEAIQNRHGGQDIGKWSLYLIGFCQARQFQFDKAKASFQSYLDKDSNGYFAIPARLGLAASEGSYGRMKVEADMLREMAAAKSVSEAQAHAWLYRASQIYMDEGYFDDARAVLTQLKESGDKTLKEAIDKDLKALDGLRS